MIRSSGRPAAEGCKSLACLGGLVRVLVAGEETAGQFALIESAEGYGGVHPRHVHRHEDELVYVLDGHVRFHVDGQAIERKTGEWLLLPKGQEHTYAILSAQARLLILLAPAGLEGYYRELACRGDHTDRYQDGERLVIVAARYGIDITGPPLPIAGGD